MQLPTFGEVYLTTDYVEGGIENLRLFKGKLISSLCGGCKKMFVIEEGHSNQGIISTLHSPEQDDYDQTFTQDGGGIQAFDNKGSVKMIVTGKKHTCFVTGDGQVYSYGFGEYGALGHGGIIELQVPKLIKRINQVSTLACGEYHTLALIQNGDLFGWGRGFEGQLGIRKDIEAASSPMFLSFFYKNPITMISCGAYHSLAVDHKGVLYGWGEARFGQLGSGRKVKEMLPTVIEFKKEPALVQSQLRVGKFDEQQQVDSIVSISGGYGHSAAVTQSGELYTWGFNQRGQLGNGDKDRKSQYFPIRIKEDLPGNQVPKFKKVVCGYYTTYAIDVNGALWSWGGGNLGFQNEKLVDLPRQLVIEDRTFTNIFANGQSAAFFAQMRTISIKPNHGPSTGGTIISLIGTGFCETGRQSVRFRVGDQFMEVGAEYDPQTESFRCHTPNFEEQIERFPLECSVEVTLDGNVYIESEQKFLIYSSKIGIQSVYPKCASINGGTTLLLNINIDDLTTKYLKHLHIGFQPRPKKKDEILTSKMISSTNQKPLNPLDLSLNDPELDKENWVCVEGFYEKGKISCTIPQVSQLQTDSLNFNVDVSINGQQFTGNPVVFRFYDIQIKELRPDNVMSDGGTAVQIIGDGFFDTTNKRVIFKTQYGERLIEIMWDKQDRFYQFVAPPLSWLLGGQQPTPELLNAVKQSGVQALLTLSGIEWIPMGTFYYIDPEILRIGPFSVDEKLPEEEKVKRIQAEEPVIDPLEGLNEQERTKKQEEINKLLEAEQLEIGYFFKKTGQYLSLYGENFQKTEKLIIQFIFNGQGVNAKGIFKNQQKILVQIPELELPSGFHDVVVEISLNGTSFSHSAKSFKYIGFDKTLTDQQKTKFEDEELKKLKKNQPKKK